MGFALITSVARAEDTIVNPENSIESARNLRVDNRELINTTRGEFRNDIKQERGTLETNVKQNREDFKNTVVQERTTLKDTTTQNKEAVKNDIKIKREELQKTIASKKEDFKNSINQKREDAKSEIEASKEKLKTGLLKIKDERKKETIKKIATNVQELNTKSVNNLTESINKIEEILGKIEIKAHEEELRGIDVNPILNAIASSKVVINTAKDAITNQSGKVYTANITTETNLKIDMGALRESLNTDIKNVREKVKAAHTSVKNASILLLSKSTKINEEIKVEGETTTNTN